MTTSAKDQAGGNVAAVTLPLWPARLRGLDITCTTPEYDLALDEWLLHQTDSNAAAATLRLWETSGYCVVLGRSNRSGIEADLEACRRDSVPVLRRMSGGGAVLLGPGCLCFTLTLPVHAEHQRLGITGTTAALLGRMATSLRTHLNGASVRGISDLTDGVLKFSGNAQRWQRQAFLHHGTLLYDFDLPRVGRYLRTPSREPDYRAGRSHDAFVRNLALTRTQLADWLATTWNVDRWESDWTPEPAALGGLFAQRYGRSEWHLER